MSERARIEALIEEVKAERDHATTVGVLSLFSIAVVGFLLSCTSLGGWVVLSMGIIGAIGFALFSIAEQDAHNKKKELMRELDRLDRALAFPIWM